MVEGDYGLELPITIQGTTLSAADTIKITIKSAKNGSTIIERDNIFAVICHDHNCPHLVCTDRRGGDLRQNDHRWQNAKVVCLVHILWPTGWH